MGNRVVITGIGVISPVGNGKEEFFDAIVQGRSAADRITAFDPSGFDCQFAEEVRDFNPEQYLDRKRSALECLREISQLLPADISITAFQFKKAKSITLRGEALTVNPIYDFKEALDKSSLFRKIEMGSTQPSKRKEATVQTFQMTIHLPEEQP